MSLHPYFLRLYPSIQLVHRVVAFSQVEHGDSQAIHEPLITLSIFRLFSLILV